MDKNTKTEKPKFSQYAGWMKLEQAAKECDERNKVNQQQQDSSDE